MLKEMVKNSMAEKNNKYSQKATTIESIDVDTLTVAQLHEKLQQGYSDYKKGRVQNAAIAFERFNEKHSG